MENNWLKSKVTLFSGGLLLLVYAAITKENFSIGIVIVFLGPLFYRASLLLKKAKPRGSIKFIISWYLDISLFSRPIVHLFIGRYWLKDEQSL